MSKDVFIRKRLDDGREKHYSFVKSHKKSHKKSKKKTKNEAKDRRG